MMNPHENYNQKDNSSFKKKSSKKTSITFLSGTLQTREKSYYLAANFNTSYIYLHHMQIGVQRNNVLIQDVFYELGGTVQSQHIRPGGLPVSG